MADMTYPELNSDLGTNTADGLRNVANVAANFACTLYQNSPASAIGVDPTGLGAFNNALWSRLCAPRDKLPLPPTPPFSGGQCNELYDLTLTVVFGNPDGTPGPADTRTFNNVQGPLLGWSFYKPEGTIDGVGVRFLTATTSLDFGTQAIVPGNPSVSVNSIVPVDGTDQCGNPPDAFPPVVPPLAEVEVNLNVDFGGLEIPVTVNFQPIIVPVLAIFRPTIAVNVGPITVQFGPDGVTFAPNFEVNAPITISPGVDPRPLPPSPRPIPSSEECDLSPVLDRLDQLDDKYDELLDCERCDKCYEEVVTAYGVLNSNVVNSLVGIPVRVQLENVFKPRNLPVQDGGDAPTVLYAGWFAWRVGSSNLPRQPLHYAANTFLAPEGVTGFSYTGTYQTTWQATYIGKQEVECPE